MYFLFHDGASGCDFIVFEYDIESAESIACVNFDEPEFVRVLSEFEAEESELDVY